MTTSADTPARLNHYRIVHALRGADYGVYFGADEDDALDSLARDRGYADHVAALRAGDLHNLDALRLED